MISTSELLGREPLPTEVVYRVGDCIGMFCPINTTQWEGHCGAAPHERGKTALRHFRHILRQFWDEHPDVQQIIGLTPIEHKAAQINAIRLRATRYGRMTLPWADGIERDTLIYLLEKHSWEA